MTVVEFFTENSIDNFINALYSPADVIHIIGTDIGIVKKYVEIYSKILKDRKTDKKIIARKADKYELNAVLRMYKGILESDTDFIFDLNGGDELHLTALGVLYERNLNLPEDEKKNITLSRFNINTNTMRKTDVNGCMISECNVELSVEENAKIYRGLITHKNSDGFTFDDDFKRDLSRMMKYISKKPEISVGTDGPFNRVKWNRHTGYLAQAINREYDSFGLSASYDLNSIYYTQKDGKNDHIAFLRDMLALGVIKDLCTDSGTARFKFKNPQIKKCLTTSGLVLELYIYTLAMSLKNDDGKPTFTDGASGVIIDWDGIVHSKYVPNVTNEIDVLLMKGARPIFISCKNGAVEMLELYKLRTVADEFGGKYTKAVLICEELASPDDNSAEKILRAGEFKIDVIKDTDEEALISRLKKL